METKQNNENADKLFKEFGDRIDEFVLEVKDASGNSKEDFFDKYENLRIMAEKIKAESVSKEQLIEVEDRLTDARYEFAHAFRVKSERSWWSN